MTHKMHSNRLGTKLALSSALGLIASSGMAQDGTQMVITEETPQLKETSVEFNPLAAAVSLVPGAGVFYGSVERYLGDKWAAYLGAGYGDVELDTRWVETAKDETDQPIVESGYTYSFEVGTRYYEDPIGHSFYGGGGLSYTHAYGNWSYQDESLTSDVYTVTPGLQAGYRWAWNNGVVFRAGLGAGFPYVAGESVASRDVPDATSEGVDKIKDMHSQLVIPKLDMGLGYTF